MTRLASYLSPHEMFLLDLACKPIVEAYCTKRMSGLYLVGSVLERSDFRDVDVRLMLSDKQYAKVCRTPAIRTMLAVAFTAYLRSATGLPIDFGIQPSTAANEVHGGRMRNPLGRRALTEWIGDAIDMPKPKPSPWMDPTSDEYDPHRKGPGA